MGTKSTLSILAGALFLLGFVPYIYSIWKKRTKPSKVSWIIWLALDAITATGMWLKGSLNGQIIGAVIGASIVTGLAIFKYGKPGWTELDKYCLGCCVLGLALWWVFNDPVIGILTSQVLNIVGSIPTFIATWRKPEDEDKVGWTIFWTACAFAVAAIPRRTIADAASSITFLLIETVMMVLLYICPNWRVAKVKRE